MIHDKGRYRSQPLSTVEEVVQKRASGRLIDHFLEADFGTAITFGWPVTRSRLPEQARRVPFQRTVWPSGRSKEGSTHGPTVQPARARLGRTVRRCFRRCAIVYRIRDRRTCLVEVIKNFIDGVEFVCALFTGFTSRIRVLHHE